MVNPSTEFLELADAPALALTGLMHRGTPPNADALAGREYRGANVGSAVRLLGMRRFLKGFKQAGAGVDGYNVRVPGPDLAAPWSTAAWLNGRREFGFFHVAHVDPEATDNRYLNAILLDYSRLNARFDPAQAIRDYVVRVHPQRDDLLLGHALIAAGRLRLPACFFVLEATD